MQKQYRKKKKPTYNHVRDTYQAFKIIPLKPSPWFEVNRNMSPLLPPRRWRLIASTQNLLLPPSIILRTLSWPRHGPWTKAVDVLHHNLVSHFGIEHLLSWGLSQS